MNLAYHYLIVYWNTACLSINAGADESVKDNKSTDYGKIAIAIAQMKNEGVNIGLPTINEAKFDFDRLPMVLTKEKIAKCSDFFNNPFFII